MFNSESLQEKWAPILEHSEIDNISDKYRKAVTSILLENQEKFLKEEAGVLSEARTYNVCWYRWFQWFFYRYWSCCRFRPCTDLLDQT